MAYVFAQEVIEAYRSLLGPHLLPPNTPDLEQAFEMDKRMWLMDIEQSATPVNLPDDDPMLGTKKMTA
jgi:hypothetical protein